MISTKRKRRQTLRRLAGQRPNPATFGSLGTTAFSAVILLLPRIWRGSAETSERLCLYGPAPHCTG